MQLAMSPWQGSSRLVGQSNFAATHIPPSDSPSNPMHLHYHHPHHASPLPVPPCISTTSTSMHLTHLRIHRPPSCHESILISVSTASTGGGVLFQAGVLFSIEDVKIWPILAHLGKFRLFCRKFTHLLMDFQRPK